MNNKYMIKAKIKHLLVGLLVILASGQSCFADILMIGYGHRERYQDIRTPEEKKEEGEQEELEEMKGDTLLTAAARAGNVVRVQELLRESRQDINEFNESGETALMLAAENDHVAVVKVLLDAGAQINKGDECRALHEQPTEVEGEFEFVRCDRKGETALMYAAEEGQADVMRVLLDAGAKVNAHDSNGDTALIFAARFGHEAAVRALLENATPGNRVNMALANKYGWTALMVAAQGGYTGVVKELLEAGEPGGGAGLNKINGIGKTALMCAIQSGSVETVKLLLNAGARVDIVDQNGEAALINALQYGDVAMVEMLLQANAADNTEEFDMFTALVGACNEGQADMVKVLLKFGEEDENELIVNLGNVVDDNRTPLMYATQKRSSEGVKLLLAAGARVNEVDDNQRTALMYAAQYAFPEIVQLLLDEGATVGLTDSTGKTDLMIAITGSSELVALYKEGINELFMGTEEDRQQIVEMLIEAAGERMNEQQMHDYIDKEDNYEQNTALMMASVFDNFEIVRMLVLAGADPNHVCFFKETPFNQASDEMKQVITDAQEEVAQSQRLSQMLAEQPGIVGEHVSVTGVIDLIKEYGLNPYGAEAMALRASLARREQEAEEKEKEEKEKEEEIKEEGAGE